MEFCRHRWHHATKPWVAPQAVAAAVPRPGSQGASKLQGLGLSVITCAAPGDGPSSTPPEPGATRKATVRDATRLAKIFGPSRYPAFVPDESLVSRPAPPPPPGGRPAGPPGGRTARPNGAGPLFTAPPAGGRARAGAATAAPPAPPRPVDAKALISKASHWRDLAPLLLPSVASGSGQQQQPKQLGAATLAALAQRLGQLSEITPVQDENEAEEIRQLGEQLAVMTRMYLGTSLGPLETCAVLQALLAVGVEPTDNWLMAAENASAAHMHTILTEYSRVVAADKADIRAANQELLIRVKSILRLSAALLSAGHTPRASWLEQLSDCSCLALGHVATCAGEHLAASSPAHQGRKGPLITMPKTLSPDQVVTAEGDFVDMPATAPEPQPPATPPPPPTVSQGWDSVPQLAPAEWAAVSQALLVWKLPVEDTWLQAYLDASYGALSATCAAVAVELDQATPAGTAGGSDTLDGAPLAARALDSSVIADLATSMVMAGVKPSMDWLAVLEAASAAVFQRVAAGSTLGESGLGAHPASAVNIMLVMRECERPLRQEWVEGALIAAAADESTRATGDHLASLLFESCRPGWQLQAAAVKAATVLANRAGALWDEQSALERQRVARGGRADEARDVTGFSAQGLTFMLAGLARLQALSIMPARWLQAWGDQAVAKSQEFELASIVVSLQSAAVAGVVLPPRTIHVLAGQALEVLHRAGAATASGKAPPPSPTSTTSSSESPSLSQSDSANAWLEVLEALAQQPVQLPAPWTTLLQDLTVHHLRFTRPQQMVRALQVLGLVPEPADPSFLRTLLEAYGAEGGLQTPEGCVAMAGALVGVGADADVLQIVESAAVDRLPAAPGAGCATPWAELLSVLATGGRLPGALFWEGLGRATGDVSVLSLQEVCGLMTAFATLRVVRPAEMAELGVEWIDTLCSEAARRLPTVQVDQELVPLLGAMGSMWRAWPSEVLADVEGACCRDQGVALRPQAITACVLMFTRAGHAPGPEWCKAAAAAMAAQLQQADAQDLVAFLSGVRQLEGLRAVTTDGRLISAVMDTAGKRAASNALQPSEVVAIVAAARELKEEGVTSVGGATPAVSSLLERALGLRDLMTSGEICELARSVRGLGVKPSPRWVATLLTRFESSDLLEAGPESASHLAACLDAWSVSCSAPLLANLTSCLARMTAACTRGRELVVAGRTEDMPLEFVLEQVDLVVRSSLQLLHALVNLQRALPMEQQAALGGHQEQIWQDLAGLLGAGHVPPELHDSLLYAAARLSSRGPRASSDGAEEGDVQGEVEEEESQQGGPAAALSAAAVSATRQHLAGYAPAQLGMVFSTMASMRMQLPADWLERFWEYSRPQLRGYPVELLLAVVSGLASLTPSVPPPRLSPSVSPPRIWEDELMSCLAAAAPQCSVQDVNKLLQGLQAADLVPPATVLQSLLDAALSSQQTAAARLAAAKAAAAGPAPLAAGSTAPSRTGRTAAAAAGGAAPAAAPAGAAAAAGAAEEQSLVGSGRTTARRRGAADATGRSGGGGSRIAQPAVAAAGPAGAAGAAAGQGGSAQSSVQASITSKAVGAAAAQQAFVLGQVVGRVVIGYGYVPDRSWLALCQELLAPALASPHLPLSKRSDMDKLMKQIMATQE